MVEFFKVLQVIAENGIIIVTIFIFGSYTALAVFSAIAMIQYMRKNSFVDYSVILSSPLAPSISVIAPAYNEGKTIVDNIRSLLSLHYNDFEVIIVNDGSTDDSLEKIVKAYDLEMTQVIFEEKLKTKTVKGIYHSRNPAFSKLKVIDKENGGKADALNAGINLSNKEFISVVDVDSILVDNALLIMAKPFLEQTNKRIIATGGVIRIANSCKIEEGRITEVKFPRRLLPRMQVLEYTRAFLMGRMAWSKLNGLLLVSGAFGMFDRAVVIECGGYESNLVGEDMELIVRMRRFMADNKQNYRVVYIPDPLCWTEVPSNLKILTRQRDRWTRGNMESLFIHFRLFFNPKYKTLGLLGHPYWFFFEWLAPIIEFIGITYFIIIAILGFSNWPFFILLLLAVYLFAVTLSFWAVLYEEFSFHRYLKTREVLRMLVNALVEPILFHPVVLYSNLKGNFKYFTGEKTWGKMERQGFLSDNKNKKRVDKMASATSK